MQAIIGRVGDYLVRGCEHDDVQTVIRINEETLPEHYSDYFYYDILSEFSEGFLVAEIEGKVVGYVMARIEYGFSHLKKLGLSRKGHIVSVAVMEQHRGKGIGSLLMLKAQEAMAAKGATECYLEVRVSNTEAVNLYQRLAYRTAGRLEAYYKDGEAALVMATPIGH